MLPFSVLSARLEASGQAYLNSFIELAILIVVVVLSNESKQVPREARLADIEVEELLLLKQNGRSHLSR
jgi:hypothetical protein